MSAFWAWLMKTLDVTKGNWYYEMQILMIVIMWQHDMSINTCNYERGLRIGRLFIWIDSQWSVCKLPGKVGWFFVRLTRNTDNFRHPKRKLRVMWINLKCIVRSSEPIRSLQSLKAYLRLHKAGFRIAHSRSETTGLEINRFFWADKTIEDFADIDFVDGKYSTVRQGRVTRIGIE